MMRRRRAPKRPLGNLTKPERTDLLLVLLEKIGRKPTTVDALVSKLSAPVMQAGRNRPRHRLIAGLAALEVRRLLKTDRLGNVILTPLGRRK
jgi:hypothetical protein